MTSTQVADESWAIRSGLILIPVFGAPPEGSTSDPDRNAGSATLLEVRAIEKIRFGETRTPFLRFGDRVRIDVLDNEDRTIFGPIDHTIVNAASLDP